MTKRIGSVDFFRGFCMFLMFLGHLSGWLMSPQAFEIQYIVIWVPLEPIAKGTGFILVSGVSVALSISKKTNLYDDLYEEKARIVRNNSYIRALLLFVIALFINVIMMFMYPGAKILDWWVLLTLSVCLLFAWPLMKLNVKNRIIFGIGLLVFNYIFFQILLYYEPSLNILAFLRDFLYSIDTRQNPFLSFFPFFIFGTVIGTYLKNIDFSRNDNMEDFIRKFSIPLVISSAISIIFGILFKYPAFLVTNSFSYIIYAIGLNSMILTLLITLDKFTNINFNSEYNPLFYFSYYSFTFYLLHYVFMLIAIPALSYWVFWAVFIVLFFAMTFLFYVMYRAIAGLFSLKYLISLSGEYLTLKIEEKYHNKKTMAFDNLVGKLKLNIRILQ
jgi:uncharacterized membrane protein